MSLLIHPGQEFFQPFHYLLCASSASATTDHLFRLVVFQVR